jgi:hypothetical protein
VLLGCLAVEVPSIVDELHLSLEIELKSGEAKQAKPSGGIEPR